MGEHKHFKVKPLTQGSDSWLEWRNSGITATDMTVILGSNPYSTPLKLWEKKCGYAREDKVNSAMQHGIDNEGKVRDYINNFFAFDYAKFSPICVEGEKEHYLASLDGFDFKNEFLAEIKCPSSAKILDDIKNNEKVPAYWEDQILWQASIVKPKKAFFAVYDYRTEDFYIISYKILPERYKEIQKKADDFWNKIKYCVPPEAQSGDYEEIEDHNLRKQLNEYNLVCKSLKVISNQKDILKKSIERYGSGRSFSSGGFKICLTKPRKSYDIDGMISDGIPVDNYVKKNSSKGSYRIICPK